MLNTVLERSVFRLDFVLNFDAVIDHVIKGEGELSDFVLRHNRRTGGVVASGDFLDGVGELRHRAGDGAPGDNPDESGEEQQTAPDAENDVTETRCGSERFYGVDFGDDSPFQTFHRERRVGAEHRSLAIVGVFGFRDSSGGGGLRALGFDFEFTDCGGGFGFSVRAEQVAFFIRRHVFYEPGVGQRFVAVLPGVADEVCLT